MKWDGRVTETKGQGAQRDKYKSVPTTNIHLCHIYFTKAFIFSSLIDELSQSLQHR